jgi:hypothetical protein
MICLTTVSHLEHEDDITEEQIQDCIDYAYNGERGTRTSYMPWYAFASLETHHIINILVYSDSPVSSSSFPSSFSSPDESSVELNELTIRLTMGKYLS